MGLTHDHLIEVIFDRKYSKQEDDGVCHGYASMGMQAFFAKDLETFSKRIESMSKVIDNQSTKAKIHFRLKDVDKLFMNVKKKHFIRYKKEFLSALGMDLKMNNNDYLKLLFQQDENSKAVKKLIIRLSAHQLSLSIKNIERKRKKTIHDYRKQLLVSLNKPASLKDDQFYNLLKLNKNSNNPFIKKYYRDYKHIDKKLNTEERNLATARAFIEILTLYQLPHLFPDWFEKKDEPSSQESHLAFSRGLPTALTKKIPIFKKNLGTKEKKPVDTLEIPLIGKYTSFVGIYDREDLITFFKILCPPPDLQLDVAFMLSSSDHTIVVMNDSTNDSWIAIDANILPASFNKFDNEIDLAEFVLRAFFNTKNAGFITHVYSRTKDTPSLKSWLSEVTQLPDWAAIHNPQGKQAVVDYNNVSLLYLAAADGKTNLVKALLACKNPSVDVNCALSDSQETPLQIAADKGHVEIVRLLLNHSSINPNVLNKEGLSPLHMAAQNGHAEIVSLLLHHKNHSIHIHQKNIDGSSPLLLAIQFEHVKVVEELLKSKNNIINFDEIIHGNLTLRSCIESKKNIEIIKLMQNYIPHTKKRDIDNIAKEDYLGHKDKKIKKTNDQFFSGSYSKFKFNHRADPRNQENRQEKRADEDTLEIPVKKRRK